MSVYTSSKLWILHFTGHRDNLKQSACYITACYIRLATVAVLISFTPKDPSCSRPLITMRHVDLPRLLWLAICANCVGALAQDGPRILRAATRRSDLLMRDTRIVQKFESEVAYIEGLSVLLQMSHRADILEQILGNTAVRSSHQQSRLRPGSLYCILRRLNASSKMFNAKLGG